MYIKQDLIDKALSTFHHLEAETLELSTKEALVALCIKNARCFEYAVQSRILQEQLDLPPIQLPSIPGNIASRFLSSSNHRLLAGSKSNPAYTLELLSENYFLTPTNDQMYQSSIGNLNNNQLYGLKRQFHKVKRVSGDKITKNVEAKKTKKLKEAQIATIVDIVDQIKGYEKSVANFIQVKEGKTRKTKKTEKKGKVNPLDVNDTSFGGFNIVNQIRKDYNKSVINLGEKVPIENDLPMVMAEQELEVIESVEELIELKLKKLIHISRTQKSVKRTQTLASPSRAKYKKIRSTKAKTKKLSTQNAKSKGESVHKAEEISANEESDKKAKKSTRKLSAQKAKSKGEGVQKVEEINGNEESDKNAKKRKRGKRRNGQKDDKVKTKQESDQKD